MANYEIIRVDMDVKGDDENQLLALLELLRKRMQKTGEDMAKAMGDVRKSTVGGMVSLGQIFKQITSGSKSAYGSLKRTVLSFDELNRLSKKTGSSGSKNQYGYVLEDAANAMEKLQQLGAAVKENLIDPIRQFPQLGAVEGVQNLADGVLNLLGITRSSNGMLELYGYAWDRLNLKTDFWKDTLTHVNALSADFNRQMVSSGLAADNTAKAMEALGASVAGNSKDYSFLEQSAAHCWQEISKLWGGAGQWFSGSVTQPIDQAFGDLFTDIDQQAAATSADVEQLFGGLGEAFSQKFSKAWEQVGAAFSEGGQVSTQVESGVLTGLKQMVNSLIGGINRVTVEPFTGLNTVLDKLQNIKIGTLKPFSFLTWRISAPKIPYLAQGAVLPANKPFLAMVGDQHHGTNIEAPLATIQEALGLVMDDYMQGNMAGHAATVDVLRQLLGAVMGISIGDATIAAACDRHHQKMAIVNGR